MRILWQSFTPPGTAYLERLRETLQRLSPPDVEVEVVGLDPPDAHIHRISELRCGYQVLAQNVDAAERGYDAVVVGHFQDGGAHELRAALDIPVVGLGECAMHHAIQLGDAFGLVTIHPDHRAFHQRQVRSYRLDDRCVGVRAMTTTPQTYQAAFAGDSERVRLVAEEFEQQARALVLAGADVVIPAGGFPALLLWEHDCVPDLGGASVLDPMGLAVGQAALWARLGSARVTPGRTGSFARPQVEVIDEVRSSLRSTGTFNARITKSTSREGDKKMSGVSRIAHAVWTGAIETGEGRLSAESGAYSDLPYTFASRTAQKAELTDPEELLATAHAGCFAMSLASTLTQAGRPATRQSVSAEVTLGPTPAGRRITSSEVTIDVEFDSPVEPGWFAEQVEAADQRCPFSALVRDSGGSVSVSIVNPS